MFTLLGYHAQTEYHTENAMTIMLNTVTTTTTEQEKANVFGVLFQLNYLQGKAQLAMKKFTESESALQKVCTLCTDHMTFKGGLALKIKKIHIHLYFIPTCTYEKNALV